MPTLSIQSLNALLKAIREVHEYNKSEVSTMERCASALAGRDAVQETALSPVTLNLLTLEAQGARQCELIAAECFPQSVILDNRAPAFLSTECSAAVPCACEAAWQ